MLTPTGKGYCKELTKTNNVSFKCSLTALIYVGDISIAAASILTFRYRRNLAQNGSRASLPLQRFRAIANTQ